MENLKNEVLAMYDVRGIQNYIFRTSKVKDAIGASAIVENIIKDSLYDAVNQEDANSKLKTDLEWCTDEEPHPYIENQYDIQVLYIGGGNAFVTYKSRELCLRINRRMAKYIIDHTYSLQLAVSVVEKTDDYSVDYNNVFEKMNATKQNMVMSRPIGALPVMDIDVKTGYPVTEIVQDRKESTESLLKKQSEKVVRAGIVNEERILDNYVTEKGVDSTIAVVHIDGNNMGLRIRELISGLHTYTEAVTKMRNISFYINSSYKKVFEEMRLYFNQNAGKKEPFAGKKTQNFVLKILVAGDDITYVCNGKIALETVNYYCNKITGYTMNGKKDACSIRDYGFSVCAGIAYVGSHFPFYVAYETAEACCESAKDRAKSPSYKDGERIGNWVDFHICKNIQAQNLKNMRKKEYITSYGEELLLRPYFIDTRADGESKVFTELKNSVYSFQSLKKAIQYFQMDSNIPASFAKTLRNTYPMGKARVGQFYAFLESRGWKMPDGESRLYISCDVNGKKVEKAKWYDALEIMELYVNLEEEE